MSKNCHKQRRRQQSKYALLLKSESLDNATNLLKIKKKLKIGHFKK